MRILLQAELAQLERLTGWVAAIREKLQLPRPIAHHIDLCLTELVTNIASYAYPADAKHRPIEICASRDSDRVVVQIRDLGVPFDPSTYRLPERPKSLADAAVGGQGLRLVQQFSDEIIYRRDGGTNHVTLVFKLPNG